MNFYLFGIQMSGILMVVGYSDHYLNTGPLYKWWSEFSWVFKWHLNTGPFSYRAIFDHLNTRMVWYSDPHCIQKLSKTEPAWFFEGVYLYVSGVFGFRCQAK